MTRSGMCELPEAAPPGGPDRKGSAFFPALWVFVLAFLVYCNTLYNGFVYDDNFQVVGNPWIRNVRHFKDIFFSHVWGFKGGHTTNYYRPFMHVLYMVNYYIFGLKPWGFHLVNAFLHSGVSLVLFLLLNRLLHESRDRVSVYLSPAFIASLLFAVHPIHTEVVAWIAGVPDLLVSLFGLLAIYWLISSDSGGVSGSASYALSIAAFICALFSKEIALVLPLLLAAGLYAAGRRMRGAGWYARRCFLFVLLAVLFFFLRAYILGGFAPIKRHEELSLFEYVVNAFPLFSSYLTKLLLPVNLNSFYELHPVRSLLEPRALASLAVAAGFATATVFSFRKNRIVFFALVFMAVPLLPVLYIPGVGVNTFAERYLYFPSVGLAFLVAIGLERLYAKTYRIPATAVMVALLGVLSVATVARNTVWKDDYRLWTDALAKSPESPIAHEALGYVLLNKWRTDEAIEQFEMAIRLNRISPKHTTILASHTATRV
jgi:hypothetical protein